MSNNKVRTTRPHVDNAGIAEPPTFKLQVPPVTLPANAVHLAPTSITAPNVGSASLALRRSTSLSGSWWFGGAILSGGGPGAPGQAFRS